MRYCAKSETGVVVDLSYKDESIPKMVMGEIVSPSSKESAWIFLAYLFNKIRFLPDAGLSWIQTMSPNGNDD